MMKNRNRIIGSTLGCTALFVLLFILFVVVIGNYDQITDWFAVQQTLAKFSDTKARYDIELARILDATEDDLLGEREVESLHVPQSYVTHCIRAINEWKYGSHHPFDEVLMVYRYLLEDVRWRLIRQDARRAIYRSPVASVSIELKDDEQGYETVYFVRFSYAEPNIESCYE